MLYICCTERHREHKSCDYIKMSQKRKTNAVIGVSTVSIFVRGHIHLSETKQHSFRVRHILSYAIVVLGLSLMNADSVFKGLLILLENHSYRERERCRVLLSLVHSPNDRNKRTRLKSGSRSLLWVSSGGPLQLFEPISGKPIWMWST